MPFDNIYSIYSISSGWWIYLFVYKRTYFNFVIFDIKLVKNSFLEWCVFWSLVFFYSFQIATIFISKILSFWNSAVIPILQDSLVLYCNIVRLSIDLRFELVILFAFLILIVDCSKICYFAAVIYFVEFPDVVFKDNFSLLQRSLFLHMAELENSRICN